MAKPKFLVVGGGLAGLMTVIKLAEEGHHVDVFSVVPVKRSHSVCAQGGINGAVNTKGEGDSPDIHFYDTVKGGDFLAHQAFCKDMCYKAPAVIYLMDRMGVTFNRTPEGLLDFRRFGGTLYNRTAFAGATTGQQLLYALDEQVRRYEAAGLVKKYENLEYLGMVKDEQGQCRGIVTVNLDSLEIQSFRGDAVVLATGGPGLVFGRSTNSMINTGSAASSAYQQGVKYANGEFVQIHPTAIPGYDKLRLMSESARGEGGRIWVPKKKGDERELRQIPEEDRWYFLEEKYPRFGNLVPRDIAAQEIYDVCVNKGMGIGGGHMVCLDLTHIPREELNRKLGGIMEIYEKFVGDDPRDIPMKIFPAVHYSMGGLWVDYEKTPDGLLDPQSPRNHMTNIPGLYAVGEVDYQYHGANRLGANSLLSCLTGGLVCGPAMAEYAAGMNGSAEDSSSRLFEEEEKKWQERFEALKDMKGDENPFKLHQELGEMMIRNCTIVRNNKDLQETVDALDDFTARWKNCDSLDAGKARNQSVLFINHLWNMIELAKVVAKGALMRDECRGSHLKPDFKLEQPKDQESPEYQEYLKTWHEQNDKWLKTTIAEWSEKGPQISYEPVDTSLIEPVPRRYD
ncbi:MAG: succinate dehydrogenase flavoprotein subunit [Candidatus Omnitrophica bacterium]|nr:succinate dehydrogenase flavoprotein subunit [Candidatus Omnitrophota bacterium]